MHALSRCFLIASLACACAGVVRAEEGCGSLDPAFVSPDRRDLTALQEAREQAKKVEQCKESTPTPAKAAEMLNAESQIAKTMWKSAADVQVGTVSPDERRARTSMGRRRSTCLAFLSALIRNRK